MDAALKDRWLRALRSGRYKQTVETLRYVDNNNKPSYCCLGVLCNTSRQGTWAGTGDAEYWLKGSIYLDGDLTMYPNPDSNDKEYAFGLTAEENKTLTQMNDSGKTFLEIADWIEANII